MKPPRFSSAVRRRCSVLLLTTLLALSSGALLGSASAQDAPAAEVTPAAAPIESPAPEETSVAPADTGATPVSLPEAAVIEPSVAAEPTVAVEPTVAPEPQVRPAAEPVETVSAPLAVDAPSSTKTEPVRTAAPRTAAVRFSSLATPAPTVTQCNGMDGAGLELRCTITVENFINQATGETSSTTTTQECFGPAGAPICQQPVVTTSGSLVTTIEQCNNSVNGGGSTLACSVTVTNTFTQPIVTSSISVNQCNALAADTARACNPFPATANPAAITQCNGSGNGGTQVAPVTCTASGTQTSALAVVIRQCNDSANGGGSKVTCDATMTNRVVAAAAPTDPTPAPTATSTPAPTATAAPTDPAAGPSSAPADPTPSAQPASPPAGDPPVAPPAPDAPVLGPTAPPPAAPGPNPPAPNAPGPEGPAPDAPAPDAGPGLAPRPDAGVVSNGDLGENGRTRKSAAGDAGTGVGGGVGTGDGLGGTGSDLTGNGVNDRLARTGSSVDAVTVWGLTSLLVGGFLLLLARPRPMRTVPAGRHRR